MRLGFLFYCLLLRLAVFLDNFTESPPKALEIIRALIKRMITKIPRKLLRLIGIRASAAVAMTQGTTKWQGL
ncbi:hypothetical protein IW261DRAFT_1164529 [Armillaria novae-zelandiae]|uniref:Secreted protein n=1 Tax=Armillaria novae-zelandiae TaxID=153914 RepID=A0AA39NFU2_9AGAR|nr:hypothetical protein IW261DRAFT_1164529 [Armillaria novae-zelandiae]